MSKKQIVVAIVKEHLDPPQKFIFLFQPADKAKILQQLGRLAADPEVEFTWYDAAVVSQRISRMIGGCV